MNAWLNRFLNLVFLDKTMRRSPQEIAVDLHRVDRVLRSSMPEISHPGDLHSSIMVAVRSEARSTALREEARDNRTSQPPIGLKFAAGTIALAIAALGLAAFLQYRSDSGPRAEAIGSLNSTVLAASDAPKKLNPLLPLETELSLLTRDIETTAKALRYSAPL